jgi:hypothetical protein
MAMKKITLTMSEEDAKRMEQAFKDGKLKEFGIESIEIPPAENRQWADPSLEKRGGKLKSDSGPTFP